MWGKIILVVKEVNNVSCVSTLNLFDIRTKSLHSSLQDSKQHLLHLSDFGIIWVFKHIEASCNKYTNEILLNLLLTPQELNVFFEYVLEMLQ